MYPAVNSESDLRPGSPRRRPRRTPRLASCSERVVQPLDSACHGKVSPFAAGYPLYQQVQVLETVGEDAGVRANRLRVVLPFAGW